MKDAKQLGTSPEVLQHYLAAGIDCQVIAAPYRGAIGKLSGLCVHMAYPVRLYGGIGIPTPSLSMRLEGVLPVLRPFSALTEQLPDGTIPAVEVAKMAFANPHFVNSEAPKISTSGDSFKISFGERRKPYVLIMPGFSVFWVDSDDDVNVPSNYISIIDYLRGKHFALPVNGRPLVEGVDYIAKSSAAVPTIEKSKAAAD